MTDEEFLHYFSGGLDIKGQRVTAELGVLEGHEAIASAMTSRPGRIFLIQVNHGQRFPVGFEPREEFQARMAKVDAAVERWLVVHG